MKNRFSICRTANLQIIRRSRGKMKVNVFSRESISITVILRMYRRIFSALLTFWPIFISLWGKFYQRSEAMGKENKNFWALYNVGSRAMEIYRERPLNSEGRKEKVESNFSLTLQLRRSSKISSCYVNKCW